MEEVENFTYLGSIVDNLVGTDADVIARIGKARVDFFLLKKFGLLEPSIHTKIRIFQYQREICACYFLERNMENNS